ncbi:MAG TPA: hypothetical protein VGP51_05665, partial [Nocardioidaceae bacterium]|nr:hypothetical protein [Nocardioidaceae bacterium]
MKVIFCSVQYRSRWPLMNSDPLSESIPMIGNGKASVMCHQRCEHPPLGLVLHRGGLGPGNANVSHVRVLTEITRGIPALVTHAVDLVEAGLLLIPVRPGADRDLGLQQGAGLGTRAAPQLQPLAFSGQLAVDRGRAHRGQLRGSLLGQVELATGPQPSHHLTHERRHPLSGRGVHHRPHLPHRGQHLFVVGRRPRPAGLGHPL